MTVVITMIKDIDKIIKRLINISYEISDEFEVLASLSYHDGEETKIFNDHIEHLKALFNSESVIINNLDLNDLKEIYKILPSHDDESVAYERTHINIEDRIEELEYMENNQNYEEEINDDDVQENQDLEDDQELAQIEKYYLEDEINEQFELPFVNYITIIALKSIRNRINTTEPDNKNDYKYKKRLLKKLKTFKYLVFSQNNRLEKLGLNYRFNVTKIPYLDFPNIDTSIISYNHCLLLLSKLYDPIDEDDELDNTAINLFNMMCLEEYLKNVDASNLEKLLMFCDELTEKSKNPYFGNIAKAKILTKSKN